MSKEIILITGASRGLGKKISENLSKSKKFIVYSGVRNTKEAVTNTIPIKLDYYDPSTLNDCVNTIISEQGKIDIIIHNAGIAYYSPVDSLTLEEVKNLFEVNFFGPFRLTQLFLPFMRKQNYGKIIFISSIRTVDNFPYMGMYSASKAAMEAIAYDWAITLSKWNILVSIIQPGPMNTNIELKEGSYFQKNQNPYLPYFNTSVICYPVEKIAKLIINNLKLKNPKFKLQPDPFALLAVKKYNKDFDGQKWLNEKKTLIFK